MWPMKFGPTTNPNPPVGSYPLPLMLCEASCGGNSGGGGSSSPKQRRWLLLLLVAVAPPPSSDGNCCFSRRRRLLFLPAMAAASPCRGCCFSRQRLLPLPNNKRTPFLTVPFTNRPLCVQSSK